MKKKIGAAMRRNGPPLALALALALAQGGTTGYVSAVTAAAAAVTRAVPTAAATTLGARPACLFPPRAADVVAWHAEGRRWLMRPPLGSLERERSTLQRLQ